MNAPASFPTLSVEPRAPRLLDRFIPVSPQQCIPPRRAERPGWFQLLLGIPMIFVVQPVAGTLVVMTGSTHLTANGRLDSLPETLFVIATFGIPLALLGYWLLACFVGGWPVTGVGGRGAALHEFPVGLTIGALLMNTVVAILILLGFYHVVDAGQSTRILASLGAGILTGFTGEILFRGILLHLIEDWVETQWVLVITSSLFGISHLGNAHATVFGAVTIALKTGVLLGACYLLTRRLWLVIRLHVAWNFVQGGIFGSDISGTESGRGLTEARLTDPDLLIGGIMGTEASVVAIIMCMTASMAMLLAVRRRESVAPPCWCRSPQAALDGTQSV